MNTITERIIVYSEDGDRNYPDSLEITMDDTQQACPVTFWQGDKAVFSMANEEIPAFIKALSSLDSSNT